jgi:hypothetical protein
VLVPVLLDLDARQLDEVEAAYRATFTGGGPGDTAIVLLSEAWAALDPVNALDRISAWPPNVRLPAQKAVLRAWARRNAGPAIQWAERIRDDGSAVEAALLGWAESGDAGLWNYIAQMPVSLTQQSILIETMKWVVAREGFEGLFAHVEALPDDAPKAFKETAIGTATALVANFTPTVALSFAERHSADPNGVGLLRRVAVRWVEQDAPAAMQYLLDRPASPARDWAFQEAYRRWLRLDRAAALAWVSESAASDQRFAPIADVHAVALANADPEHRGDAIRRAIGWAEQIADPGERHEALVKLGVMWLHYEPDAATEWLARNGLEAEVRAEVARYQRIQERFSGAP